MIRIALYLCPQTVLSSLSMADDAFRLANQLAGEALFALQRVSIDGQQVQLGYARVQVDGDLQLAESADLLLIPATGSALERKVVDAMTTNETLFFRDVHPFEALRHTLLPELLARRDKTRTLQVW